MKKASPSANAHLIRCAFYQLLLLALQPRRDILLRRGFARRRLLARSFVDEKETHRFAGKSDL
jgi:hypothetical protein